MKYKISYSIGNTNSNYNKHCFGVNSLAFSKETNILFSAGRDSTIKSWNINNSNSSFKYHSCYEGHTDWVNDIFLDNTENFMVSCSSDSTIKIWNSSTQEIIRTLDKQHDDYVKVLAYAPNVNYFASSGLDSHILLWDLNTCSISSNLVVDNNDNRNTRLVGKAGSEGISIYSLAITKDASLVLSGSTERAIRAWDPKSGQKIFKLKGHTENIRSIILNNQGDKCISASTDGTFRLWDIGTQRVIQIYDDIHTDSVWSLAATDSFSHVFSGGRDGLIFSTDLKTQKSTLICKEPNPILKIYNNERDKSLWVSTTDSSIKNWNISSIYDKTQENTLLDDDELVDDDKNYSNNKEENVSQLLYDRKNNQEVQQPEPQQQIQLQHQELQEQQQNPLTEEPSIIIEGRPGIVKHHVLNNRRQILTKDADEIVLLWDVLRGQEVKNFGKTDFDSKCEELTEIVHIPKWFNVDTKTGGIYITLENPTGLSADAHLTNLGFPDKYDDDDLINIGEKVLLSLFSKYQKERLAEPDTKHSSSSSVDSLGSNSSTSSNVTAIPLSSSISSTSNLYTNNRDLTPRELPSSITPSTSQDNLSKLPSPSPLVAPQQQQPPVKKPLLFELPPSTDIVILEETSNSILLRSKIDELTAEDFVPDWVKVAISGRFKKENKMVTLMLIPVDERNISALGRRVQASTSFQIKKICYHIAENLNPRIVGEPLVPKPDEFIEILCNSKVLDNNYSLATVKSFFWKSTEDLKLYYRIKHQYGNEMEIKKLLSRSYKQKSVNSSPSIIGQSSQNDPNLCNYVNGIPNLSISSSPGTIYNRQNQQHSSMHYSNVNK
eukprot:gene5684-7074_t